MNDRKIERSYGRCFGLQQLLAISIEIFISHEKWLVAALQPAQAKQESGPKSLAVDFAL